MDDRDKPVDLEFTKALPKIELHAHLTGSISTATLHEIWLSRRSRDPRFALEDPLIALPPEKVNYDVIAFFPLFDRYIYNLCNTVESVALATAQVLRDFHADGVRYLELRTTPRENPATSLTKDVYVSTVLDCIASFDRFEMATYLILSVDRRNTPEQAMTTVELAIKYRDRGVVGVDLCGNPARGDASTFCSAFARAKEAGLKLTVHFAEIPESSTREELEILLSYRPDRLGHVINVPGDIKDEIARRKLGLELCLSCNVHAKLIQGSFSDHHFAYWKDKGCPISLCTDDVGIFRSSVSNEYLLAAQHFGLTRHQLVMLLHSALPSIFGGEREIERMQDRLMNF